MLRCERRGEEEGGRGGGQCEGEEWVATGSSLFFGEGQDARAWAINYRSGLV